VEARDSLRDVEVFEMVDGRVEEEDEKKSR
jgi:hypothetical protein